MTLPLPETAADAGGYEPMTPVDEPIYQCPSCHCVYAEHEITDPDHKCPTRSCGWQIDQDQDRVDGPRDAEVAALAARIAELEAEVEDRRTQVQVMIDDLSDAREERDKLRAELAALKAACEPFAEYAASVDESAHDLNPIDDACPPVGGYADPHRPQNAKPVPTIGDCHRLAALLAPPPATGGPP